MRECMQPQVRGRKRSHAHMLASLHPCLPARAGAHVCMRAWGGLLLGGACTRRRAHAHKVRANALARMIRACSRLCRWRRGPWGMHARACLCLCRPRAGLQWARRGPAWACSGPAFMGPGWAHNWHATGRNWPTAARDWPAAGPRLAPRLPASGPQLAHSWPTAGPQPARMCAPTVCSPRAVVC